MLGPHWPPRLAAWLGLSLGSITGPRWSAMVAPRSLRRQVGSCKGRMSPGSSAAGFLPIQTRRSMEGPRTWSKSS
eukprot:5189810-Pyramimonas_sp.AAC.1